MTSLVVTGTPGVGKSTVCEILARRLPKAAHVEVDVLQRMIVSGGEWPAAGTAESHQQLLLRTRNAAAIAANFVRAGFTAIIDEVVGTAEQVEILDAALASTGLSFVILTAPTATVLQRDALRTKHTASSYLGADQLVSNALAGRAVVIASGDRSAEQTAAAITARVPDLAWTR